MAGCVDQVQGIGEAIFCCIRKGHSLTLYGNTPFPFNIHGVKDLVFKIALGDDPGFLDETIREG